MNEKAIYEIGNLIHVRRGWKFQMLLPIEIVQSAEYKMFKEKYPTICELAEK